MGRAYQPRARLLEALGVTRVARVTGLDRTGVEVACAVRPAGHVLQVCQGKGETWDSAWWSAVGEASELSAAEQAPPPVTFAAARALAGEAWLPEEVGGATDAALAGADVPQGWLRARRLDAPGQVWVPAAALYCPPPGTPWAGPLAARWTSSGLGAGRTPGAALEHALLEAFEREALARVLPEGWTVQAVAGRRLEPSAVRAAWTGAPGFEVLAFDLTPKGAPLPLVGALLLDLEEGPIPLTAGYAARRTPAAALRAAVLEAAQSRATEVHGAREDVVRADRQAGVALAQELRRARARRLLAALPGRPHAPLARLLGAPAAAWRYPGAPLPVVKVVVKGFRVAEVLA